VSETALAEHAGLAQGEEGDVLLVEPSSLSMLARMVSDAFGEEGTLEVVPDERTSLGVVGEQHLREKQGSCLGNSCLYVLQRGHMRRRSDRIGTNTLLIAMLQA